jgi:hypothetical protein
MQVEWPAKAAYVEVRLYPGVVSVGLHDFPLFKKDGTPFPSKYDQDKQAMLPKTCLNYNPETYERDLGVECPFCDADLYFKVEYWAEGIVMDEVENEPSKHKPTSAEKESGFKDL